MCLMAKAKALLHVWVSNYAFISRVEKTFVFPSVHVSIINYEYLNVITRFVCVYMYAYKFRNEKK